MSVDASGQQAKGQRQFLETLQELLKLPAGSMQAALGSVARHLSTVLQADKVDAFLYEPNSDSLQAMGTSDTPLGRKQRKLGLDRLPLSNGGKVVSIYRTAQPILEGRVDQDSEELRGIREALGIRSQIGVPLYVGGTLRGVLSLTSTQPEFFTSEDLSFVETVSHWVGVVAHRSELFEELTRRAAEEGRRAGAEELITILAHDLTNYLASLKIRIDLILRRAMNEHRPADIRDATSASDALQRLTRLTSDLLDVSRLEQGLFALRSQPVDLTEISSECAATLSPPGSDIKLLGDEEVIVPADPDRIRQALENLVANAVKHSPRGIPVSINVSRQTLSDGKPWGVIQIIDEGPGIPSELLPHIFERFVTSSHSKGLGLGLYLAHRIAAAHGGTLTVNTSPKTGTRFVLSLPMDEENPRSEAEEDTKPRSRPISRFSGGTRPDKRWQELASKMDAELEKEGP